MMLTAVVASLFPIFTLVLIADLGVSNEDAKTVAQHCGCGGVALLVMGRVSGHDWNPERVIDACGGNRAREGMSIKDVCDAGKSLGLDLSGIECNAGKLLELLPAIVFLAEGHNGKPHFVVATEGPQGYVKILDPPHSDQRTTFEDFKNNWSGIAIVAGDKLDAPDHLTLTQSKVALCAVAMMAGAGLLLKRRENGRRT